MWGRGLSGSSSGCEGDSHGPHHTHRSEPVLASTLRALCSPAPVWGPGKVKDSLQQLDSQATDPEQRRPCDGCPTCGCLLCGPRVGPILLYLPDTLLEFTRICIRLHSKPLTHISLFNALMALGGRIWSQAMWWMTYWCPPRGPHLFSTCCMPVLYSPQQSERTQPPPISQVRTS